MSTQGLVVFVITLCAMYNVHHHQRGGSRELVINEVTAFSSKTPPLVAVHIMSLLQRNCTWEYKLGIKFIRDEGEGASYSCNIGQEIAAGKLLKITHKP